MPAINLRLIEVFLCAARHQNISRAAQELYISQPALSKTISRLEKDYGGPLFSRRSRVVLAWRRERHVPASADFAAFLQPVDSGAGPADVI